MKNPFTLLSRLSLVLVSALTLGACSRAQYATLPRSTPYLGSTPVAAAPQATTPAVAPAATSATEAVAATPVAPLATEAVVVAKATPAPVVAPAAAAPVAVQAATAPAAVAPAKLNLVQRIALSKVTKKINKLAASTPQLKQRSATASTTRGGLDERLRTAILLTLIAIVVGILAGVVSVPFIGVIAGIIFVVALVFVILYLIDQV